MPATSKWERIASRVEPLLLGKDRRRFWGALKQSLLLEEPLDRQDEWRALWHAVVVTTWFPNTSIGFDLLDAHEAAQRQRGRFVEGDELHYRVFRLGISYNLKDRETYLKEYEAIEWDRLPDWPLFRALRLRIAVTRNRKAEVHAVLRRGTGSPLLPEDRARYLRIMADHFATSAGCIRRGGILADRAADICAQYATFDAQVSWARNVALSARTLVGTCEPIDLLLKKLKLARDTVAKYRLDPEIALITTGLAKLLIEKGQYDQARELGREGLALLRRGVTKTSRSLIASFEFEAQFSVFLRCAICLGDASAAAKCVRSAERLLCYCNTPKYEGGYHLMKGEALSLTSKPEAAARAFEEFDRAEASFRRVGDGFESGINQVNLARGRLYEKLKQSQLALQCAEKVVIPSDLLLAGACLELKSRILLSPDLPNRHRLYEDILANLGQAWGPAPLFKVVANLYMYSWELGDDLEMTDYHLKQVNRMANHLDEPTFQRLYTEHVTKPVFRRALEKTFGLSLPAVN